MPKKIIYRVRALPGKLVVHPQSVGTGSIHFIGHSKYLDDKDVRYPFGKPVASQKYKFEEPGIEVVEETGDGYFAEKFRVGDLEYIETVPAFDTKEGAGFKDPILVGLTAKVRAKNAALAAAVEVPKI